MQNAGNETSRHTIKAQIVVSSHEMGVVHNTNISEMKRIRLQKKALQLIDLFCQLFVQLFILTVHNVVISHKLMTTEPMVYTNMKIIMHVYGYIIQCHCMQICKELLQVAS